MNKRLGLLIFVIAMAIFTSCKKNDGGGHGHGDGHETNDELENSPNQALYEEVMDIHDEVMPKMNDLHKANGSLQARLAEPGTAKAEKAAIRDRIARIDSASEGMMVWMRQFNPLPDSSGEDEARAYLEGELVKVKKVRQEILDALKSDTQ